jgi:hypothetical protein
MSEEATGMEWVSIPPRIAQPALDFMQARTIAIWGDHPVHTQGEPRQYGSGVLLRVADARFVVTANHVCRLFLEQGCSCFLSGAEKLIPLGNAKVWRLESSDLAVIRLTESVWTALSPGKSFARLPELDGRDETHEVGGIYCVFGYPSDSSTTDHEARMHKMVAEHVWGIPYGAHKQPLLSFDPTRHIAIEFREGSHPHPGGMSGCGMWRVLKAGVPGATWFTDDIRLVAIEHTLGHRDGDALVGSRIGYLPTMIEAHDPSLAPVLALEWPMRARTRTDRLVQG